MVKHTQTIRRQFVSPKKEILFYMSCFKSAVTSTEAIGKITGAPVLLKRGQIK